MCISTSRAARVTLGVMLTALAACADEPSPTAPVPGLAPQFAIGDVLTVTNTSGGTDVGSLRWAMSHITGGEVIRFDPGLAGQTIVLDTTIATHEPFTIEGPADNGITISGGGKVRVFDVSVGTDDTLVFRNLTIADGKATGGAGIIVRGSNASSVKLENSTLTGHVADAWPAMLGIATTLINTTISGNTATLTTNASPAIASTKLALVNSTIAHNTSAGVNSGALVLRNSIISNNDDENCTNASLLNTYEGDNISDDDTCGDPFEIMVTDPQLSPLADNGGPTRTHAITAGSPAINAGTSCSVGTDQRYAPRDAQCDLGAYEFLDFTTVALTMASSAAIDKSGWAVLTGTVKCSRQEAFDLHVELKQLQKSGKGTVDVHAVTTTPIVCSTSVQPWAVALVTTDEPFQIGSADASAGTLNTKPWVTSAYMSQPVKVFKSRK